RVWCLFVIKMARGQIRRLSAFQVASSGSTGSTMTDSPFRSMYQPLKLSCFSSLNRDQVHMPGRISFIWNSRVKQVILPPTRSKGGYNSLHTMRARARCARRAPHADGNRQDRLRKDLRCLLAGVDDDVDQGDQ